jgi:bilirubin oxidase
MGHMDGMVGMTHSSLAAVDAMPAGASLHELPRLANESSARGLFRAELAALPAQVELIPGTKSTRWLYNGTAVGPLIDVREGDTVEIRFVNHLPQPSTIHWHGLPVPAAQDGNPRERVEPGRSRVYRFTLPPGSAGTYWYHPHPHALSAEQVFRGLAGPIIVRAGDDPLAEFPERHLFVTDLKLAADGSVAPNDMMDWMNGREGQFALVNGQRRPRIAVAGSERWRIWNASNARYLRLTLGGHEFAQVGTDGGLLAAPRSGLTELLLAPAERAEIVVPARSAGTALLAADVYDRHKMSMSDGSLPASALLPLADVDFVPGAARALPTTLRALTSLGEPKAVKKIVFAERMDMAMLKAGAAANERPRGMKFLINGKTFELGRVDLVSRRGEVELWEIDNQSDMDHPFHLHGTQFQVVEREQNGVSVDEPYVAWRDTVNVRRGEKVRFKTVQQSAGIRMFHCHILEHEDLGMMGQLQVI